MDWPTIYSHLKGDLNDPIAWASLEGKVRARTRAHCRHLPWHVIEDIVADTCSDVAIAFEEARGPDSFGGFVLGFWLNERRRWTADHLRVPFRIDEHTLQAPAAGAEDPLALRFGDLWVALNQLPRRERKAVSLRHFEGLSANEIARELDVSPANARQIVHCALVRLRAYLERQRYADQSKTASQESSQKPVGLTS